MVWFWVKWSNCTRRATAAHCGYLDLDRGLEQQWGTLKSKSRNWQWAYLCSFLLSPSLLTVASSWIVDTGQTERTQKPLVLARGAGDATPNVHSAWRNPVFPLSSYFLFLGPKLSLGSCCGSNSKRSFHTWCSREWELPFCLEGWGDRRARKCHCSVLSVLWALGPRCRCCLGPKLACVWGTHATDLQRLENWTDIRTTAHRRQVGACSLNPSSQFNLRLTQK